MTNRPPSPVPSAHYPAPPIPLRSLGWQLGLSAYWFATSMKWFLLLLVVIPDQVRVLVPGGEKGTAWGTVYMAGAIWAVVGPGLFGYLSDRTRSRFGRWRPYLVMGSLLTVVALMSLANAREYWMIVVGYLLLQISDDVATGPYSALIPALVSEEQRGRASGIMGLFNLLAQVVGTVVAFLLQGVATAIYLALAVINLLCMLTTLAVVRDEPPPRQSNGAGFVASWIEPWRSADFRWVWLTRFLSALGFYLVLTYLLYFLGDVVRQFHFFGRTLFGTGDGGEEAVQEAAKWAMYTLGLLVSFFGALGAVVGGRLADRIGRKRVACGAAALMAVVLPPFILYPDFTFIMVLSVLFGIGYGAYQSAAWALASDVMPSRDDLAKDMGIWQASIATPQIFSGAVGRLVDWGNAWRPGYGYTFTFLFAGLAFAVGTLLIMRIRGSR